MISGIQMISGIYVCMHLIKQIWAHTHTEVTAIYAFHEILQALHALMGTIQGSSHQPPPPISPPSSSIVVWAHSRLRFKQKQLRNPARGQRPRRSRPISEADANQLLENLQLDVM